MTSKTPKIKHADPESVSVWVGKIREKYPHLRKDSFEFVPDPAYLVRLMSETDFTPNPATFAGVGKRGAPSGLVLIVNRHLSIEMLADLERHLDALNTPKASKAEEPSLEPCEIPDSIKVDDDEIEINRAALEGSW